MTFALLNTAPACVMCGGDADELWDDLFDDDWEPYPGDEDDDDDIYDDDWEP